MKVALLLLILAPFQISVTEARTPEEIRAAIQGLVSQRHPDHVDEFWASLGPEALPVLKSMYAQNTNAVEKAWLLDGLSRFDDPSIGTLLQGEIAKTDNAVMRKKLLAALIRSQGEAALGFAEPYLDDSDPHVRKAVAQSLKQYAGGDRVQKKLKDYLEREKEPWVRRDVEKTLVVAKNLKREDRANSQKEEGVPPPAPLTPAQWAGEWKGAWITPGKNSAATLQLTLVNEKANESQQKWRMELKLPKKSKMELKERELEISVFSGASVHWLEIRHKKTDAIFIAHRKVK